MGGNVWGHSFSAYAQFSKKRGTCAYQGLRNISFSENFANALNEWYHMIKDVKIVFKDAFI